MVSLNNVAFFKPLQYRAVRYTIWQFSVQTRQRWPDFSENRWTFKSSLDLHFCCWQLFLKTALKSVTSPIVTKSRISIKFSANFEHFREKLLTTRMKIWSCFISPKIFRIIESLENTFTTAQRWPFRTENCQILYRTARNCISQKWAE